MEVDASINTPFPVEKVIEIVMDTNVETIASQPSSVTSCSTSYARNKTKRVNTHPLICPVRKYPDDIMTSAFLLVHASGFIRKYSASTCSVTHQVKHLHSQVLKIKHCVQYDCIVTVEKEGDIMYICSYHNWRTNPQQLDVDHHHVVHAQKVHQVEEVVIEENSTEQDPYLKNIVGQTRAYKLPLASLSVSQTNVLISVCDVTGRVAICESHNTVNLYSCETGPFEHVCELRIALPAHGLLKNVQFLHPWLACASTNEVQVCYIDVIKKSSVYENSIKKHNESRQHSEHASVDFVFDGATGHDILANAETSPGRIMVPPLQSTIYAIPTNTNASVVHQCFEGPLEVIRDCRNNRKVLRMNAACGYMLRPACGGFRQVLYRRFWPHQPVSIVALLPFVNEKDNSQSHKNSFRIHSGVQYSCNNSCGHVQLLIGSNERMSCYLLQRPVMKHSKLPPYIPQNYSGGQNHSEIPTHVETRAAHLSSRMKYKDCIIKSDYDYCFPNDRKLIAISPTPRWLFVWTTKRLEVWTYPHWVHQRDINRQKYSMNKECQNNLVTMQERQQILQRLQNYEIGDLLITEWLSFHCESQKSLQLNSCQFKASPPILCFTRRIEVPKNVFHSMENDRTRTCDTNTRFVVVTGSFIVSSYFKVAPTDTEKSIHQTQAAEFFAHKHSDKRYLKSLINFLPSGLGADSRLSEDSVTTKNDVTELPERCIFHVAQFSSLTMSLATHVVVNTVNTARPSKKVEGLHKATCPSAFWESSNNTEANYPIPILLDVFYMLQQRILDLKQQASLLKTCYSDDSGQILHSVEFVSHCARLEHYVKLLKYISEYIGVKWIDSKCLEKRNMASEPHHVSDELIASLFLANGWSSTISIMKQLVVNPRRRVILLSFLKLLAILAPTALTLKPQHKVQYYPDLLPGMQSQSICSIFLHYHHQRRDLDLSSVKDVQIFLRQLLSTDLAPSALPEMLQFPLFTTTHAYARALLDAITKKLPEIYTTASPELQSRVCCAKVLLRCFLMCRQYSAACMQHTNVEIPPTKKNDFKFDQFLEANGEVIESLCKVLSDVEKPVLLQFCVDMIAILRGKTDQESSQCNNSDKHNAEPSPFAIIFWYCIANCSTLGMSCMVHIFRKLLQVMDTSTALKGADVGYLNVAASLLRVMSHVDIIKSTSSSMSFEIDVSVIGLAQAVIESILTNGKHNDYNVLQLYVLANAVTLLMRAYCSLLRYSSSDKNVQHLLDTADQDLGKFCYPPSDSSAMRNANTFLQQMEPDMVNITTSIDNKRKNMTRWMLQMLVSVIMRLPSGLQCQCPSLIDQVLVDSKLNHQLPGKTSIDILFLARQRYIRECVLIIILKRLSLIFKNFDCRSTPNQLQIKFNEGVWNELNCLFECDLNSWKDIIAIFDALLTSLGATKFISVQINDVFVNPARLLRFKRNGAAPTLPIYMTAQFGQELNEISAMFLDSLHMQHVKDGIEVTGMLLGDCATLIRSMFEQVLKKLASHGIMFEYIYDLIPQSGDMAFYIPFIQEVLTSFETDGASDTRSRFLHQVSSRSRISMQQSQLWNL